MYRNRRERSKEVAVRVVRAQELYYSLLKKYILHKRCRGYTICTYGVFLRAFDRGFVPPGLNGFVVTLIYLKLSKFCSFSESSSINAEQQHWKLNNCELYLPLFADGYT